MRRRLDELEHHQEEFLAMLAHELRAPLVPIRTGIAILDRPEATDAERAWARGFCRANAGEVIFAADKYTLAAR
jgi:signal transduction histidine kinase